MARDYLNDVLVPEYQAWLAANPDVPKISADEAILEEVVTDQQRGWLLDFGRRWHAAARARTTFAEFAAAGRRVTPQEFADDYDQDWYDVPGCGATAFLAYGPLRQPPLVIEVHATPTGEQYSLLIGNYLETSDDLAPLERKLYEYGITEEILP